MKTFLINYLNLDQVFRGQEKRSFKKSRARSNVPLVLQSKTVCAILVDVIMGNFPVKLF